VLEPNKKKDIYDAITNNKKNNTRFLHPIKGIIRKKNPLLTYNLLLT